MLTKVRHFVPINKLLSIYYAILASHLFYGCQIWGLNNNRALFKKVFNQQKRAMRILTFSRYTDPSEPLFKSLNVLKLTDYISVLNCLFVHDYFHHKLPTSFDNYFVQKFTTQIPGEICSTKLLQISDHKSINISSIHI